MAIKLKQNALRKKSPTRNKRPVKTALKKRSTKKTSSLSGKKIEVAGGIDVTRKALYNIEQRIKSYVNGRGQGLPELGKRKYAAAQITDSRSDWITTPVPPYWDLYRAIRILIARSRDASQNNPFVKSIIHSLCVNVIGAGLKVAPRVKLPNGGTDKSLNKRLADLWERFCDEVDVTGKCDFAEMQTQALQACIITGGALSQEVNSAEGSLLPIAFKMFDQYSLNTFQDTQLMPNDKGQKVLHGILFNDDYLPQEYHFINSVTGTMIGPEDVIKVKANQIIHTYRRFEPYQLIGVPWLTSALPMLWDIDSIIEDTCIASRIRASIAIWLERSDEVFPDPSNVDTDESGDQSVSLEPGAIWRTRKEPKILQSSSEIEKVVEPIIKMLLHAVGSSMGLSYQMISRDTQSASYSAAKMNYIQDIENFTTLREWFGRDYCKKYYSYFVKQAALAGLVKGLSVNDFKKNSWGLSQCVVDGTDWEPLDPLKDAQADVFRRQNGLTTDRDYYARQGQDYYEVYEQLAQEKTERKTLKLNDPGLNVNYDANEVPENTEGAGGK